MFYDQLCPGVSLPLFLTLPLSVPHISVLCYIFVDLQSLHLREHHSLWIQLRTAALSGHMHLSVPILFLPLPVCAQTHPGHSILLTQSFVCISFSLRTLSHSACRSFLIPPPHLKKKSEPPPLVLSVHILECQMASCSQEGRPTLPSPKQPRHMVLCYGVRP